MKSTKPILIAAVIIAALILIGARVDKPTYTVRTVTVEPGDTLWELGEKYAPKANREEWMYEVCRMNGIDANLQIWQEIKVLEVVK